MIYILPSEAAGLEALEALVRRFPVERRDHPAATSVFLDTFDWRLYRAGHRLAAATRRRGTTLVWSPAPGAGARRVEVEAVPAFAGDLPAGPFAAELAPIVAMRRLLPAVELERRIRTLQVLDGEGKTVARVHLRVDRAGEPGAKDRADLPATLRAEPLRGYDRELAAVVRVLEEEIGLEPAAYDELAAALGVLGRRPGDYSSKLDLALDPAMRADEALVAICRTLLDTVLANEDGTRRDLDSEFLHDFRVAVRRTRSALSQLRRIFLPPAVERFRSELAWLGGVTGPTRDLDVYLLKIDGYEASLAPEIRADLEPLRDFLERRQRLEQQRLAAALASERYRELVRTWRRFVAEPPAGAGADAGRPLRDLASERIWKAYRRVRKKGRGIDGETPPAALHRLRIACKKLRYLLEFFRGLWEPPEIEPLIKALKRLQDNLGDFNDLEVQREKLRDYALRMEEEGAASVATLLAMGELLAGLRRLQDAERRQLARRFGRFSSAANHRAFCRLFGSGTDPDR